jgi:hypothetical protein
VTTDLSKIGGPAPAVALSGVLQEIGINSIAIVPDGDLLLSARSTSAVYTVSRAR